MNQAEIIDILKRSFALQENVELPNGTVAAYLPVMDRLLEDPIVTNRLVVEGFQRFDGTQQKKIKCILSPATDQLFGFSAATAAWARFIYADEESGAPVLNHGFVMNKNEGVVLVVSAITDAVQVQALAELVKAADAKLVGVLTLVDCTDGAGLDAPVVSLM